MDTSNIVCFNGININSYTEKNVITVYDCEADKHIAELKFNLNVYNFRIKSDYLIVVLDFKIKIFSIFLNLELVESILYHCSFYSFNIFDINSCFKKDIFAISNDNNSGQFFIHNIKLNDDLEKEIEDVEPKDTIIAHKDKVIFIKINFTGDYVSTMSKKGTNIKIFSTISKELIFKFKRGIENAEYSTIAFDLFTNFIAVYTNKGTIHIWNLTKDFERSHIEKLLKLDYHRDHFNNKFKSNLKGMLLLDKNKKLSFWSYNGSKYNFTINEKKNELKYINESKILI